jgi:hypothetical protein
MVFSIFLSSDGLFKATSVSIVSTASSSPPPDFDVVMAEELVFPLSEDDPEPSLVLALMAREMGCEAAEVLDTASIPGDDLGADSGPGISDTMIHSNA